ncbi:MAG: tryptophan synthase subunit alpha [Pseudonocardiales bacterium]|nr:tryptophan synthase subunit alpha [Pseudonocardiales bacterium]
MTSPASGFFARRRAGEPGLALFLNAGDPPLGMLGDIVQMLDELRVDCLELAVPFPDSCTDGPVIRRSAARALRTGVDLAAVLGVLDTVRAERTHLRVALLVDWSHTIKPDSMPEFIARLAESAADALLVHGLPPRLRPDYYRAAREHQIPIITTCYPRSSVPVQAQAAAHASAYLYLVAHYGRSGSRPAVGFGELTPVLGALRAQATVPLAVGFGIRDHRDVRALAEIGADAAIIGSAGVERIEHALTHHTDPVQALADVVQALRPTPARD